jgi:GntR family transcriptional regulator/MocR family aminotransferase
LIRPGDRVGVEALGYRPAWEVLRAQGAELVPLPVDASGLDVEAVAALCQRRRLRALYVTPHHQYPTLATLSAPRRVALLALAAKHRFAIIEDDYDHEFHYEGRPVLPLASADGAGVVLYVGTLSKILAPGLRVGWVVATPPLLAALEAMRSTLDSQGDLVVEAALAELMEDGVLQRHAKKARNVYRARRDLLAGLLGSELGGELSFRVPSGGMALWAKSEKRDADAWAAAASSHDLVLHSARHFAFDGRSRPYLRLGYARLDERALGEAVRRLARSRPVASRKRLG